ncbi:MAG: hypothetical protein WC785_10610, partial [Tatlockia sp.]
MTSNPHFYVSEKKADCIYTRKPQGRLNGNRLVQNLPAWQIEGVKSIAKPKTLILADWTAWDWSFEKMAAIFNVLGRLMDEGFTLYVKNGSLQRLEKADLTLANSRLFKSHPSEIYPDFLTRFAKKLLDVPSSELLFLDDYWMDILLGVNKEHPGRKLSIEALFSNKSNLKDIFELVRQASFPFDEIVLDSFTAEGFAILQEVKDAFPHMPIATDFKQIVLTQEDVSQLLANQAVVHGEWRFDPACLNHLTALQIIGDIPAIDLVQLLNKLPKLKTLRLEKVTIDAPLLTEMQLDHLEVLDISGGSIEAASLQSIFSRAPGLQSLNFANSTLSGTFSESFELPHLNYFQIVLTECSTQNFSQIVNNAPRLRILTLDSPFWEGEFTEIHFPCLELLETSDTGCELEHFILNSPQLKHLNLSGFQPDFLESPNCSDLSNLVSLDASRSIMSAVDLEAFLRKTRHLEQLSVEGCTTLEEPFTADLNLTHLKQLYAARSNIPHANLLQLLSTNRMLQDLSLQGLSEELIKGIHWSKLHKLHLSGNINTRSFQNLLTQTRTLTELTLECFFNEEIQNKLPLQALKALHLTGSNLSTESLKWLLKSAPQLKRVTFASCNNVIMDEELEDLLQGIESNIVFSGSNIEPAEMDLCYSSPTFISSHLLVDADTVFDPEQSTLVAELFVPLNAPTVEVNDYRLSVFDTAEIEVNPCAITHAFSLKNRNLPYLIPADCKPTENLAERAKTLANQSKEVTGYLGRQRLKLTEEWQAIASLSASEGLTHYEISPKETAIEIQYSQRDNLYYIRSKKGSADIGFDFLVQLSPAKPPELPKQIAVAVNYFSSFGEGVLKLAGIDNPTGGDYLKAILKQKKGSCRHRALAFKAYMQLWHPKIAVRVITNACHAFVEVLIEQHWLTCDLGGYDAKLVVDKSLHSPQNNIPFAPKTPLEAWYEKALETWVRPKADSTGVHPYCEHVLSSKVYQKKLIE